MPPKAKPATRANRGAPRPGLRPAFQVTLRVQYAVDRRGLPAPASFQRWVRAALTDAPFTKAELGIRLVASAESARLNAQYRSKKGATNVLSFPYTSGASGCLQGDLVICAPLVRREARAAAKAEIAHWAHLVVHGILHLRGFDHQTDRAAARMEALETRLLQGLGFGNPYLES